MAALGASTCRHFSPEAPHTSETAALLSEILKPPANNNLNLSSSTKNQG